ncbi:ATP12, ATPase F1F0-assembly protein, partial [Cynara cardunculus var. scolymus]
HSTIYIVGSLPIGKRRSQIPWTLASSHSSAVVNLWIVESREGKHHKLLHPAEQRPFSRMATAILKKTFNSLNPNDIILRSLSSYAAAAATNAGQPQTDDTPSSFTFSPDQNDDSNDNSKGNSGGSDDIYIKSKKPPPSTSVTMPMSFMTGSIVGKRFYKQVTTRAADDGNGWSVMLDYRTLKTPSKRPLKCTTLALAKAIAAEWEYQLSDGIRPFTMPLMKLACTALERVPLTRSKIIDNLLQRFHQDLVFCRAPDDDVLTSGVHELQVKKIDPLLEWVESEFGFKPVVYSSFFGGKQEDGFVEKWGLVEGGHDLDVADLKVQVSSAAVFLGLTKRFANGV